MQRIPSRYVVDVAPRTWFGRLVVTAAALSFVALTLLFFSVFLMLVIALIPLLLIRAAWLSRAGQRKTDSAIIDVQYSVTTRNSSGNHVVREIADGNASRQVDD